MSLRLPSPVLQGKDVCLTGRLPQAVRIGAEVRRGENCLAFASLRSHPAHVDDPFSCADVGLSGYRICFEIRVCDIVTNRGGTRFLLPAGAGGKPKERRNQRMREYEVGFIIHPDLEDEETNAMIEKIKGWIVDSGGQVTDVDIWGRRRLAYQIQHQREGFYAFMQTQMPPTAVARLERNLRIAEPVMRHIVVRTDE